MTFTPDAFETALAQLNSQCGQKPDHVVLNIHKSCEPQVDIVIQRIAAASANQLLYQLDLRTIYHSEGNPVNWSLESCSKAKSLAIIGQLPTA